MTTNRSRYPTSNLGHRKGSRPYKVCRRRSYVCGVLGHVWLYLLRALSLKGESGLHQCLSGEMKLQKGCIAPALTSLAQSFTWNLIQISLRVKAHSWEISVARGQILVTQIDALMADAQEPWTTSFFPCTEVKALLITYPGCCVH